MNRETPDPSKKNLGDQLAQVSVPTFACIVYVGPCDGGVHARVANLAGFQCEAPTEREALSQLVPAFKKRVAELMQNESPIPWVDPPSPIEADEQQRYIPVHL